MQETEYQLISIKVRELQSHDLVATIVIIDLSRNHQWMVRLINETLMATGYWQSLKSFLKPRGLIHYSGEVFGGVSRRHHQDMWLKLISPIMGQTNITCLLTQCTRKRGHCQSSVSLTKIPTQTQIAREKLDTHWGPLRVIAYTLKKCQDHERLGKTVSVLQVKGH